MLGSSKPFRYRQTDTYRQKDRETYRDTYRQKDRDTYRDTYIQTDRQKQPC